MSDSDDLTKHDELCAQLLRDDVQTYRNLETWGSSLFLGAIALTGKQLFEWKNPVTTEAKAVELHELALLPLVIGLVGFTFLRIANFRGRNAREDLRSLAPPPPNAVTARPRIFGAFGWLIAMMPLSLGYFVSWYLLRDEVDPQLNPCLFWGPGVVTLLIAFLVDLVTRISRRKAVRETQSQSAE